MLIISWIVFSIVVILPAVAFVISLGDVMKYNKETSQYEVATLVQRFKTGATGIAFTLLILSFGIGVLVGIVSCISFLYRYYF